jgi:Na+-transporting NADH:ubiquinone oxidoreductase subunit NqrB
MIGFYDVVQILDLSMDRFLGAFAFGLQFRKRDPVGWSFVRVDCLVPAFDGLG